MLFSCIKVVSETHPYIQKRRLRPYASAYPLHFSLTEIASFIIILFSLFLQLLLDFPKPRRGFDIVEVVGSSPIDPTSTVGLVSQHETIGKSGRFFVLLRRAIGREMITWGGNSTAVISLEIPVLTDELDPFTIIVRLRVLLIIILF